MKIKKDDFVIIKKGKDSGKKAKVVKVFPKLNKVMIENINKYKKHIKPSKKHPHGGIVDINSPVNTANIMIICPNCKKSTRIKFKISNNSKIRVCTKCSQSLDSKE